MLANPRLILPPDFKRLAARLLGQCRLEASAPHTLDDSVEALLAGFALDPAVTNTAWEVDRATPEA